ncbi:CYTH and CHAD domain-containing protein [Azonexus sp. R2A61]|uniref:CYTH and CHAD domain-containing protein n=1 Tax=Azonexus sp. R2A61 TaxID=2744443 RepID=UPI001F318C66|nr:CYTH and CHAD domain-containing protein [Azonexus sp. R2A61]
MATEIELKLSLKPGDARKLLEHPLLRNLPTQRLKLLNTYYDTPDLRLHAQRIALRFRKKGWEWLLTVKSAEPASGGLAVRNEWECPAAPGNFDFSHVDRTELRNLLDGARPELKAVFTTDFKRQVWQVPFGESRIELALDRGEIASGKTKERICEVELELLSGRIEDIFGLTRKLQAHFHLRPSIASKAERGYRLFLRTPEQPFRAKPIALHAGQTPVEAFRAIALACLEHFQRNEAGLLAGGEAEFIHQARVALRRLRSAIKLFAPVLPKDFVATYGQTWRALASALGEARNWDVFQEETLPPMLATFPESPDLRRLQARAEQRARYARRSIVKLLAVREYPRLILEFAAAIYALQETGNTPIKQFARERVASYTQSARKLAERYAELDAAQRHEMRLKFKRLRYAIEFLENTLPARQTRQALSALHRLQETLGRINDASEALLLLNELQGKQPAGIAHGWLNGQLEILVSSQARSLESWLKDGSTGRQGMQ